MSSGKALNEATDLLNDWLDAYPGIKKYRETQPDKTRALGYVD